MKRQSYTLLLSMMLCFTLVPFNAYAAEKIKSVNIKIEAETDDENAGTPDLEISAKSNKYSVDDYEVTNDLDDDEDSTGGPGASGSTNKTTSNSNKPFTCEITLSASGDYVFDTLSKSNIKVSGLGANCTKASRKDSGKTLVLTVELQDIHLMVSNIETATWTNDSKATWAAAKNATTYTLRIYKDGKLRGTYETGGTEYDFSPIMLKEGHYHYTVKAMNGEASSKERTESETVYINTEKVIRNKERYSLQYDNAVETDGPNDRIAPVNAGWQKDGDKYWFRTDNGMYPQMNWLQMGADWFFFDKDGYLVTDGSITWKGKQYYFDSDGKLIN